MHLCIYAYTTTYNMYKLTKNKSNFLNVDSSLFYCTLTVSLIVEVQSNVCTALPALVCLKQVTVLRVWTIFQNRN